MNRLVLWPLLTEGVFLLSEFKTFGSAQRACNILIGKDLKLKGRHALTPLHLHTWLQGLPPASRPPGLHVILPPSEQQVLQMSGGVYPGVRERQLVYLVY